MSVLTGQDNGMKLILPASDASLDLELARRLTLLAREAPDTDSAASNISIIVALLYWMGAAALVWVIMLVLGN